MTTLSIPEMSCGHCQASVDKAIHGLDPLAILTFDMAARTVAVQSGAALDQLRAALAVVGYEATAA